MGSVCVARLFRGCPMIEAFAEPTAVVFGCRAKDGPDCYDSNARCGASGLERLAPTISRLQGRRDARTGIGRSSLQRSIRRLTLRSDSEDPTHSLMQSSIAGHNSAAAGYAAAAAGGLRAAESARLTELGIEPRLEPRRDSRGSSLSSSPRHSTTVCVRCDRACPVGLVIHPHTPAIPVGK